MTKTSASVLSAVAAAVAAGGTAEDLPQITAADMKAFAPAIAAELSAEGATAERARVLGIQAAAFPGQDELAAKLIADGKTTAGDAALQFNAAQKGKLKTAAAAIISNDKLAEDVNPAPVVIQPGAEKEGDGLEGEVKWKAKWGADAKLRAEFGDDEKSYLAFCKADAGGKIRVLHGRPAA